MPHLTREFYVFVCVWVAGVNAIWMKSLTKTLLSSHQHVGSHHAADAEQADAHADEMHHLIPHQQEEPGQQEHDGDDEAVQ